MSTLINAHIKFSCLWFCGWFWSWKGKLWGDYEVSGGFVVILGWLTQLVSALLWLQCLSTIFQVKQQPLQRTRTEQQIPWSLEYWSSGSWVAHLIRLLASVSFWVSIKYLSSCNDAVRLETPLVDVFWVQVSIIMIISIKLSTIQGESSFKGQGILQGVLLGLFLQPLTGEVLAFLLGVEGLVFHM